MDCIAINLDFGYESKVSGMLFAQMEKGALDSEEAQDVVHKMKLSELVASMNISDSDSGLALSLYFEGNAEALEAMSKTSNNPVVFHALRLMEQSKGKEQSYARVIDLVNKHDALKAEIDDAYADILPLVKKYADEGREPAKVLLADMLMYGWGIGQDTKKAEEMFSVLAESGNVYAQFVMVQSRLVPVKKLTPQEAEEAYQMGEKYYYGRGVAQDYQKAAEYYLKAANVGHAEAQYSLGFCYMYGYGVNKDLQKAREWFTKAAAQGHQQARNVLDYMNRNGQ